jgi:hypothetical protein
VTSDNCVWVYAVADDIDPAGLIGIGGAAVRRVAEAGLAAVVSSVPSGQFGEAALRRNLEDMSWLEQTARAHHAVIEAVAKERTAVPMRLATVYTSDDGVAEMLRDRAADLRQALAKITARGEWGVKIYLAKDQAPDRQPEKAQDEKPGAAYLKRRKAELNARQDARQQALTSAEAIYHELSRLADAARTYPPQSPEIAGSPTSMVLNAAYLVPDDRADDFAAAVTGLAAKHPSVQLSLTGPWPPYSFVSQGNHDESGT